MEAKIALILILSGALGNLLDRIIREEVVDFIAFSFWPSFNLADAFIVAGAVIAGVFYKKIKH
jgi:signal peptidase II